AHYRSPINYSYDAIEQCKASLTRLYTCRDSLDFANDNASMQENSDKDPAVLEFIRAHEAAFDEAMEDDLNTADAIASLFNLTRDINSAVNDEVAPSKKACEAMIASFDKLCGILGLVYNRKKDSLDEEIEALIAQRAEARKNRDFATADRIRDELKARNIILEDTPQGVKWHIEK
ncbi:MAG: cysteine--tRNA ligase, partial [Clostridia bacterium]|nr:cysteine--tRNA ligase [Clostridia bacterium]